MTRFCRSCFGKIRSLLSDDIGIAATEYAIVLALIVVIAMAAIAGVGMSVADASATVDNGLADAVAKAGS